MKFVYLLVISGVLAILSMLGVLAAYTAPAQLAQQETLIKYNQKSSLDYAIRLRPSILNGINPTTSFPSQIVNDLQFSFNYSQLDPGAEIASIEAVLENPGIWQKTISLVPETTTSGDLHLPFSLDVTAISAQFNEIEKEIKLTDAKREITLNARVKSSRGLFILSLPIKLSDTVLEVSNDLSNIQLSCAGSFLYTVNLKPNSVFATQTLNSPVFNTDLTAVRPGAVVMSRLVEGMEANLVYNFTADSAVQNLKSEVEILTVLDTPKLWNRSYTLLHTTGEGSANLYFPIDLAGYLSVLNSLGSEAGTVSDGSTITIKANIHTTGQSISGPIDEVFSPVLTGTLKGNILTWDNGMAKTQPGAIKKTIYIPNNNRYLGLSLMGIRIASGVICILLVILSVYLMILNLRRRTAPSQLNRVDYQRIKKKYGQRIVEASGESIPKGDKIVDLSSFEALAEVSDQLGKPIIHQSTTNIQVEHVLYVLDGQTRYQYTIPVANTQAQMDE
jgi:hypothetical protein